jgi:hypothetical protein
MQPVIVYLDSQDFSRFSPSHRDYEAALPTKRQLLSLRDQGVARFVFSDVLFFEALPTDPKFTSQGLERIRAIAEICGNDHLPSGMTIVEHEFKTLAGSTEALNWTEWYPRFEFERPNRQAELKEWISNTATNRKHRRTLTKLTSKRLDPSLSKLGAEQLLQKYPLFQSGKAVIQAYLRDESTWPDLKQLILDGLSDIVALSAWLGDNWKHGQRFMESLRAGNKRMQTSLSNYYDGMKSTFENSSIPEADAAKILEEIQKNEMNKAFGRIINGNSKDQALISMHEPIEHIVRHRAPSLYCAFTFIGEIIRASALPTRARNPYKKAGSDFADAMHLLFLPYVDVIRVDHFSHDTLSKAKLSFRARPCPSLTDLPKLIQTVYEERRALA